MAEQVLNVPLLNSLGIAQGFAMLHEHPPPSETCDGLIQRWYKCLLYQMEQVHSAQFMYHINIIHSSEHKIVFISNNYSSKLKTVNCNNHHFRFSILFWIKGCHVREFENESTPVFNHHLGYCSPNSQDNELSAPSPKARNLRMLPSTGQSLFTRPLCPSKSTNSYRHLIS